ncbi:unnamed protein product, partial [Rotaria magnacalcarata]
CNETFFTHFTHEKRFETCKRDIHRVYNHAFKDTPAMYTKQIVGNRNRRSAQNELIRKRPNKTLLQNTTITKKTRKKNHTNLQQSTNTVETASTLHK